MRSHSQVPGVRIWISLSEAPILPFLHPTVAGFFGAAHSLKWSLRCGLFLVALSGGI